MPDVTPVKFVLSDSVGAQAERAFSEERKKIHALLPNAEVHHIGGTSVPRLFTKEDLDIGA